MSIHTQCIRLQPDNFQAEVLEAKMPVLVDCWASWCSSFQRVNPVLSELAIEFAGQIKISRLDIAQVDQLAAYYGIRAIPTLLLFQDGQVMERVVGSVSSTELANRLRTIIVGNSHRSQIACL